ncbi:unnamed protein product [Rhizophagus irregularis]|uniref:SAM domain-containing protein n=1 Tax=Rhizophagus irregularis TaxID=588596 RepID=A0A916E5A6_9GLOM|nr:unnamed protein product [Rhizophagus irregularis]
MCSCDKTIKPNNVTRFNYSLDLTTKFNFTLSSSCHSYFQRQKKSIITKDTSNSLENNKTNDDCIILDESDDNTKHEFEVNEKSETEQITISFNLVIKPSAGPSLPSKWLKIETLSLDDILADIHHYVRKLTGNKEIMHSDYSVSFKPEKSGGVGAQLEDIQDYKKFLSDYKKLVDKKKNMSIIVSFKKKRQKRKEISDSEESKSENIKLNKKKSAVPKLENFSTILQQEGHIIRELREKYKCNQHDASCFIGDERHIKLTAMHLQCWAKEIIRSTTDDTQTLNLPIFSQSSSTKGNFKPSTPTETLLSSNMTPIFFTMTPQMISLAQNSNMVNTSNTPLSSPKLAVPSLNEFFTKLGANGDTKKLVDFKNIFENERITVDQIYDLTDAEFDQLGVNKIGWRKTFRAAAKRYK